MTTETPLSVTERFFTGMVSLVVAAVMVAVAATGFALQLPPPDSGFWESFLLISSALSVGAGIVGFVVGPARMADYFGVLWGASEPTLMQTAVIVAIVLAICAVALFEWPKW